MNGCGNDLKTSPSPSISETCPDSKTDVSPSSSVSESSHDPENISNKDSQSSQKMDKIRVSSVSETHDPEKSDISPSSNVCEDGPNPGTKDTITKGRENVSQNNRNHAETNQSTDSVSKKIQKESPDQKDVPSQPSGGNQKVEHQNGVEGQGGADPEGSAADSPKNMQADANHKQSATSAEKLDLSNDWKFGARDSSTDDDIQLSWIEQVEKRETRDRQRKRESSDTQTNHENQRNERGKDLDQYPLGQKIEKPASEKSELNLEELYQRIGQILQLSQEIKGKITYSRKRYFKKLHAKSAAPEDRNSTSDNEKVSDINGPQPSVSKTVPPRRHGARNGQKKEDIRQQSSTRKTGHSESESNGDMSQVKSSVQTSKERTDAVPKDKDMLKDDNSLLRETVGPLQNGETVNQGLETRLDQPSRSQHVIFQARLSTRMTWNSKDAIVCDQVMANEGNGYKEDTGVFEVPVTGTYSIAVFADSGSNEVPVNPQIYLMLNTRAEPRLKTRVRWHSPFYGSGSSHNLIHLSAGQKMWLRYGSSRNHPLKDSQIYFTGILLKDFNPCLLTG